MPTNAYKAGPEFREVHFESLAEIRSAREEAERLFGFALSKTTEEIRLEQEEARRSESPNPR